MQRLGFSPFNFETGFTYSSWPWTPSGPAQPLWVDKRLAPLQDWDDSGSGAHKITVSLAATLTFFSFPVVPASESGPCMLG